MNIDNKSKSLSDTEEQQVSTTAIKSYIISLIVRFFITFYYSQKRERIGSVCWERPEAVFLVMCDPSMNDL